MAETRVTRTVAAIRRLLASRSWTRISTAEHEIFAGAVRWLGIGLLLYSVTIDRLRNPALLPTAVSMIFYKTVATSGRGQ